MKRGRPKGRATSGADTSRSFGPLGDLIRAARLERGLGLLDVARACQCSVQFVSNIEHGRAPLPWNKVPMLAQILKLPAEKLQAANLAIRSDFKSFVTTSKGVLKQGAPAAAAVALAARDAPLRALLQRYQSAGVEDRKRFLRGAMALFD